MSLSGGRKHPLQGLAKPQNVWYHRCILHQLAKSGCSSKNVRTSSRKLRIVIHTSFALPSGAFSFLRSGPPIFKIGLYLLIIPHGGFNSTNNVRSRIWGFVCARAQAHTMCNRSVCCARGARQSDIYKKR